MMKFKSGGGYHKAGTAVKEPQYTGDRHYDPVSPEVFVARIKGALDGMTITTGNGPFNRNVGAADLKFEIKDLGNYLGGEDLKGMTIRLYNIVIEIVAGDEIPERLRGASLRLKREGKIVGIEDKPPAPFEINPKINKRGQFAFADVPEGSYWLRLLLPEPEKRT